MFWSMFIEMYSEALQNKLQYEEEVVKYVFEEISKKKDYFDFPMFENAKKNNEQLFEWLEQPGKYMQEFVVEQQKQHKIDLKDFESYNNMALNALDLIQQQIDEALGIPTPNIS